MDNPDTIEAAAGLARRALEILDRIGAALPALHLQHAIDVMTDAPIHKTIAEMERCLEMPECQALLRRLEGGGVR